MLAPVSDPLEDLLALQRALDARRESDWMGRGTGGGGSFPPINIFQQDHDFVAVVELPGVDRDDLEIEIQGDAIRISGRKLRHRKARASISESGAQAPWIEQL